MRVRPRPPFQDASSSAALAQLAEVLRLERRGSRFESGVRHQFSLSLLHACVVQLEETSASKPDQCGCESCHRHQAAFHIQCSCSSIIEHRASNAEVEGEIPSGSTISIHSRNANRTSAPALVANEMALQDRMRSMSSTFRHFRQTNPRHTTS